jgi:hypothetical protein
VRTAVFKLNELVYLSTAIIFYVPRILVILQLFCSVTYSSAVTVQHEIVEIVIELGLHLLGIQGDLVTVSFMLLIIVGS